MEVDMHAWRNPGKGEGSDDPTCQARPELLANHQKLKKSHKTESPSQLTEGTNCLSNLAIRTVRQHIFTV